MAAGHDQNHPLRTYVTPLLLSSPELPLQIPQTSDDLDGNGAPHASQQHVHGSQIARQGDRRVEGHSPGTSDAHEETFDVSDLRCIAERAALRKQFEPEPQADHGGMLYEPFSRHPRQLAELHSRDLATRGVECGRHLSLTQAESEARLPQLGADLGQRLSPTTPCLVKCADPIGHTWIIRCNT